MIFNWYLADDVEGGEGNGVKGANLMESNLKWIEF